MSAWNRWRIAFPLIGLNLLILVPALFGAVTWWSEETAVEQVLTVSICVVLAGSLVVAVSIGVQPVQDVPWLRIGLVLIGFVASCGLAALRREI